MKIKILALILTVFCITALFSGCYDPSVEPPDTTKESVSTSPATTEAPPPDEPKELRLYTEIFNDIGKEYSELFEKYGEADEKNETDFSAKWDERPGTYRWISTFEDRLEEVKHTWDSIGECDEITFLTPSDIFINYPLPISITDLEKQSGINYITDFAIRANSDYCKHINHVYIYEYNNATLMIGVSSKGYLNEDSMLEIVNNKYPDSPYSCSWSDNDPSYPIHFISAVINSETYGEAAEKLSEWSAITGFRVFDRLEGDLTPEEYKDLKVGEYPDRICYEIKYMTNAEMYYLRDYVERSVINGPTGK